MYDLQIGYGGTIENNETPEAALSREKINVLLVSTAGAQGITLKHVRHFHILESSTTPTLISQAIGRVARIGTHSTLEENEKNVSIWRYFSTPKKKKGIDEILYENGNIKLIEIKKIHDKLIEYCVENDPDYNRGFIKDVPDNNHIVIPEIEVNQLDQYSPDFGIKQV